MARPLLLEALEDRTAPATFGVAWPDAEHLTLSFTPDGTTVVGQAPQSQLYQLLDSQFAERSWETAILQAFQSWAVHANINIGVVPDGGQPLGSDGAPQGDSRFGDIRIGTYPLSAEVVAVAQPFDPAAGTWSGDVKLNSSYSFGPGSTYDLFTVMLHEAGHVFGVAHGDDPISVMVERFDGVRASLAAEDIANIQELYGDRAPDEFDARSSNDTLADATLLNSANQQIDGDLSTAEDVDWYRFRTHDAEATLRLRTSGLSLLTARLSLYDDSGHLVASVASTGPLDGDLELHCSDLDPSANYYLKVEKANNDVFGVGAYRLEINPDDAGSHGPNSFVDFHGEPNRPDDTLQDSLNLLQKVHRSDARFDYLYRGILGSSSDVDFYRFKSPPEVTGAANVMTVMVWSVEPTTLDPVIDVYDAHGNPIHADVLVHENGVYTLQLSDVLPNEFYHVAVRSAANDESQTQADYVLGIDFGNQPVHVETFVEAHTLSETHAADFGTFHVLQSQLFHLVLSAEGSGGSAGELSIAGPQGNTIISLAFQPGETRSATLYLTQGDHVFQFRAVAAPLTYTLRGIGLSDPIGPEAVDTTLTSQNGTAYWWEAGYYQFLALVNPAPPSEPGVPPAALIVEAPLPPSSPRVANSATLTKIATVPLALIAPDQPGSMATLSRFSQVLESVVLNRLLGAPNAAQSALERQASDAAFIDFARDPYVPAGPHSDRFRAFRNRGPTALGQPSATEPMIEIGESVSWLDERRQAEVNHPVEGSGQAPSRGHQAGPDDVDRAVADNGRAVQAFSRATLLLAYMLLIGQGAAAVLHDPGKPRE